MTIWIIGAQAGSDGTQSPGMGGVDQVRNMYQMLSLLMHTINGQTEVVLPEMANFEVRWANE